MGLAGRLGPCLPAAGAQEASGNAQVSTGFLGRAGAVQQATQGWLFRFGGKRRLRSYSCSAAVPRSLSQQDPSDPPPRSLQPLLNPPRPMFSARPAAVGRGSSGEVASSREQALSRGGWKQAGGGSCRARGGHMDGA